MKNYLALAGIHAKHSRQQSRMVILCIVLAVFLVTSVFSMADFERMHMTDKLIKDNGNWHISLNNVPFEEAERVLSEADVRAACRYDTFNYNLDKGCYLNGHPVCVIGTDQSFTDSIFADMLEEGHFPQNDSEIILSMNAKAIFACEVGDVVTVDMPEEDGTYTVCGFVSNNSDILAADVVIAVLDYPAFDSLAEANHHTREPQYYIQFRQSILTDGSENIETGKYHHRLPHAVFCCIAFHAAFLRGVWRDLSAMWTFGCRGWDRGEANAYGK